jgi:hypothetical protein
MLLLATLRSLEHAVNPHLLPAPKWAADTAPTRFSTQRAIQQLRTEVRGRGLGVSIFSGFATLSTPEREAREIRPGHPLRRALCGELSGKGPKSRGMR